MITLSEIGISLGISILGDTIKESAKEILKRLAKPKYAKYKNCFKPPFVNAFKKTLNIFYDKDISPYPISKNLYNRLYELDDIALGLIFQDINLIDVPYSNNNIYTVLAERLKRYCKINNFNTEDTFYEYWKDVFAKEYENCFKLFFAVDDSFRRDALIDIFSISIEKLDMLLQSQADIKQDIVLAKNEILGSISGIANQIRTSGAISIMQSVKEIDEDGELKKIQDLIDKYNYEECISYINLNKDDNWKNKSSEFKAKIYNKLGNCYQNLYDYQSAKQAYELSNKIDSKYDAPLYNLANIALEENDRDVYFNCFLRFNNTSSELYYKLEFFKYLCFDKEQGLAEKCLETHLVNVEDYLFLKATLILRRTHNVSTQEATQYLQEYINKTKNNTAIARYNLINCQFTDLFNKSRIQFVFDINIDGHLKINHNICKIENLNEAKQLLNNLNKTYDELCKTYKNYESLILTTKIKIFLVKYFIGEFNQDEVDINEINNFVINNCKSSESPVVEALILNILCNQYAEAHKIYNLFDNEAKKLNKNNYAIILFGEQKYKEVLEHLESEELLDELNEQFKIISLYKAEGWDCAARYIELNQDKYSDLLLGMCVWLYHNNLCYDEEVALLKKISRKIIRNPEQYNCSFAYNIAHCLAFYKTENGINELRKKLVEKYWTKDRSQDNFDMGLMYAIDLYNNGLYSKCLSILEILEKYEAGNTIIKNLYAYIDANNYNPDTLIENFEKDKSKKELLPNIAQAYIFKKEYSKAEDIINSLKYLEDFNLQYYYLKINLKMLQKADDKIIIEDFIEALKKYPDDLKLNNIAFGFLLRSSTVNDNTRKLFAQCSQVLKKHNLMYEFHIDMSNPVESLTQAIEIFEPHKKYLEREKYYEANLDNYNKFLFPLSLVAESFATKPSVLFANFLKDKKQIVALSNCTIEQQIKEITWLNKNKNVILSLQTLILIRELKIDEIVFNNLNIKITEQTKEEFNFILADITNNTTEKLVRDNEGNSRLIFVKSEVMEYRDYLKECITNLSIAKFKSKSTKALPLIEASENIGSKTLFFDGIVSLQNDYLTCSSDMVTHILSREFKFRDIAVPSIIDYLNQKNIISNEKVAELKYELIKLNCKYILLTTLDLYHNSKSSIDNLREMFCYLNESFDKKSIILVLSELIYKLSKDENFLDNKNCEIIDLIFDKCAQLDRSDVFIRLLAEDLIKCYCFLDTITQKYLAYKLWNTISDKIYIEAYYRHIMYIQMTRANHSKEKNIGETKRIVFNSPQALQQKLELYANYLIDKYT